MGIWRPADNSMNLKMNSKCSSLRAVKKKKKNTSYPLNYLRAICIKGPEAVQYKYRDVSRPESTQQRFCWILGVPAAAKGQL